MTNPRKHRCLAAALVALMMWVPNHAAWARDAAENLVLVTLDGVRWQEVFAGVDPDLLDDERYSDDPQALKESYWHEQRGERRKRLFPFLWSVIASEGSLIGDRTQESYMEVSNRWWFSYPGYNEILTGKADDRIDSNAKIWNPNVTFLEVLNLQRRYKNRVLAFGSWNVHPYVINTERSGLPVNAGFDIATNPKTKEARWLNELSAQAPRLWKAVRVDFLTHGYAMQALKNQHPRVIYIAYGETDDFAHDGSYDRYLDAAHRNDQMLANLWSWLQTDRFYRDRTTLIISTDHGRGNTQDGWPHHASPAATARRGVTEAPEGVPGSDQIWLAAVGPHIRPQGLVKGHWKQSQIAATALASLQLDPVRLMPEAAPAIDELLQR